MHPSLRFSRATAARLAAVALLLIPVASPRKAASQVPGGAIMDSLVAAPDTPPERVEIDMIFLAFDGSIMSRKMGRSRAEADSLARHFLQILRSGANFDSLKIARSDQPRAKPMNLVNSRVHPGPGDRTRGMVEVAVGDMAFGMSPGNFGLVVHNNTTCRYGYYVLARRQ